MQKDSDDDLLDAIVGSDEAPTQNGTGTAFVCDVVDDTGVCGYTAKNAGGLGSHKLRVHGIKGSSSSTDARKTASPQSKRGRSKQARPRKPVEKAVKASMPPPTDRAAVYTASLSMAAIAAYLALPPFDQRDLDVCNAGMPNVGRALAQLAETNPSVARTCDLILAGGGGGWVALLMAVVPIAGGIAANHGVLPASSGDRFAEMIDLAPAPPVPSAGVRSPQPEGPEYDEDEFNVLAYFQGTPDTVMTDATEKMMAMGGPIGVAVPFSMTPTENPDGERGSEQLRPVEPAAAEPESPTGVPA